MNAKSKALKRLIEGYKRGNYVSKVGSKSQALEYYKAKRNKKKLPTFTHHQKSTPYKQLTIEEYEKKYGI